MSAKAAFILGWFLFMSSLAIMVGNIWQNTGTFEHVRSAQQDDLQRAFPNQELRKS